MELCEDAILPNGKIVLLNYLRCTKCGEVIEKGISSRDDSSDLKDFENKLNRADKEGCPVEEE